MTSGVATMPAGEPVEPTADAEARERLRTVGALARTADAAAIEKLCEMLIGDDVSDVRGRAARALGQIANRAAVQALERALGDDDVEVRRRVVLALDQISDPSSANSLVSALSDPDRDVRRWAARGLGVIGNPAALDALRHLATDRSILVQEEARQAIRAIEDRQSLQVQRSNIEALQQRKVQTNRADVEAQVKLDGEIALKRFAISRLEARVAASESVPIVAEDESEHGRERRSLVYRLEMHIREIESLSNSTRAPRLREPWENQLRESRALLKLWTNPDHDVDVDNMQTELAQARQRLEDRCNAQNREVIELTRHSQVGYRLRLEIEQLSDTLTDPANQAKVSKCRHAADAEYELLTIAREHGDYEGAKLRYANLQELGERAELVKKREDEARAACGRWVLGFILVSVCLLTGALFLVPARSSDAESVLGVPPRVIVWSLLGSMSAMLYQFLNRPVSQLDTMKWLVARPIQGVIMGCFLYLTVAAGLFVLASPELASPSIRPDNLAAVIRPELAAVLGFLGGFSDRLADEMIKRATSILSQDPSDRRSSDRPPGAAETTSA